MAGTMPARCFSKPRAETTPMARPLSGSTTTMCRMPSRSMRPIALWTNASDGQGFDRPRRMVSQVLFEDRVAVPCDRREQIVLGEDRVRPTVGIEQQQAADLVLQHPHCGSCQGRFRRRRHDGTRDDFRQPVAVRKGVETLDCGRFHHRGPNRDRSARCCSRQTASRSLSVVAPHRASGGSSSRKISAAASASPRAV